MDQFNKKVDNFETLDEALRACLHEVGWSERQLAERSGIPRGTIRHWMQGHVKKPRQWQDLITVAEAMRLDAVQTCVLLKTAGYPPLEQMWHQVQPEERQRLTPWLAEMRPSQTRDKPFLAIPDLPYFVGRDKEIADLEQCFCQEIHPTHYVLCGMGGVGKTVLIAHLAYKLRFHFTDGVLWARLDTSDTMSILRLFADAYGKDVSSYSDVSSRSQAVRGLLANKKVLVVLDNVESSQQVEPLLPPTGPSTVVMTTRHHNLKVARGASLFHIKPFDKGQGTSLALFAKILGKAQTEAEQPTLTKIADRLGHLPLAVAIMAGRITYEPGWTAVNLWEQLQQQPQRLDMIADEGQSIRASFNMSYAGLSGAQQRFFAALGVFAGDTFDLAAVTAVTQSTRGIAQQTLALLSSLSLVMAGRDGRFQLHPLLHDFARDKLQDETVLKQMVTYFVNLVVAHTRRYDLLDQETDNILFALDVAYTHEMPEALVKGSNAFTHFLLLRGLDTVAEHHLQRAQQAAQHLEDMVALATVYSHLGRVAEKKGELLEAQSIYQTGLQYAQQSENAHACCTLLMNLGCLYNERKNYHQAQTFLNESLALAERHNILDRACALHNYLGALILNFQGNRQLAKKHYRKGLTLARKAENLPMTVLLYFNLGGLAYRKGDYTQADTYFRESQALAETISHQLMLILLKRCQAWLVIARTGDLKKATMLLREAETVTRQQNMIRVLGYLLVELGDIAVQRGRHDRATAYLDEAIKLAEDTDDPKLAVFSLTQLGILHTRRHSIETAVTHLQEAYTLGLDFHDDWQLSQILLALADLYLAQQNFVLAEDTLFELLAIAERAHFQEILACGRYGLARVALVHHSWREAIRQGEESIQIFEAIGHHRAAEVRRWLQSQRVSTI